MHTGIPSFEHEPPADDRPSVEHEPPDEDCPSVEHEPPDEDTTAPAILCDANHLW